MLILLYSKTEYINPNRDNRPIESTNHCTYTFSPSVEPYWPCLMEREAMQELDNVELEQISGGAVESFAIISEEPNSLTLPPFRTRKPYMFKLWE